MVYSIEVREWSNLFHFVVRKKVHHNLEFTLKLKGKYTMRKIVLNLFFRIIITLAIGSSTVHAVSLSIDPAATGAVPGESVSLDVTISGLGNTSPPSLGAFELDLLFDNSIISFNSVTFGNQLDISGFGSITGVAPGVGTVNIFEVSLDTPADLNSSQLASFTLATFSFTASSLGTSPLTIGRVDLSDADGFVITPDSINGAKVDVVPEPSTFALLGIGLVCVVIGYRRKRSQLV